MLSKLKNKDSIETIINEEEVIARMKQDCTKSIDSFKHYLGTIVPNTINKENILSICYSVDHKTNTKHTIKDLLQNQQITLIPEKVSAKIEILDHHISQKHSHQLHKAIQDHGYLSSEDAKHTIVIKLKPMTEDARMEMVKDIKNEYDKYKNSINDHRAKANKAIKPLPEDARHTGANEIDKHKDSYMKILDNLYKDKAKSICPNAKI